MHRHIVQFYADGVYLAKRAAAFLDQALAEGGGAVAIATAEHRQDIADAMTISNHRLLMVDAEETMEMFMEDGLPDRSRFEAAVRHLLARIPAGGNGQIHAFGEMVALLWSRGQHEAAIRLEQLWEEFGTDDRISLLCAYPITSFADSRHADGFVRICRHHHETYPSERMADQAEAAQVEQQAASLHREVERRTAAERLVEDAERQSQEFLAALGHELRNPLTPLVASLRLLDEAPSTERERLLETLQRQTGRLQQLVEDFLGSNVDTGHLKVHRRPTTLEAVLGAARAAVSPHIATRNQALLLDLPVQPVRLQGDPGLLAQVFGDVLTHASRCTSAGGSITLQARLHGTDVEVAVADTGIPAGGLAAIFEPHVHAGDEAELGRGLALVRKVVEMHGGKVEAEGSSTGGATLRIRLPRIVWPTEGQAPGARSVLVVDDQPDVAHTIRDFLRLNGHAARAVLSGPAAIAAATSQPPDVILLDLSMPEMDGYQTARLLRQEPRLEKTVIIALTGHTQQRHVEAALDAGCDHHVAKPPDPDALLGLVGRQRPVPASP